jgi:hypothetical protein
MHGARVALARQSRKENEMSSPTPQEHTTRYLDGTEQDSPGEFVERPISCSEQVAEQRQPRGASQSENAYVCVTAECYQEILRHATHNDVWPQYFLLINACLENIKRLPPTSEQCDQADVETLLIECLERLADAIAIILPGGIGEFQSYLKQAAYNQRHGCS